MLGRIKVIKPSLYGFILDEDGIEYFFHAQNYNEDWEELKKISPPITHKGPVVQFKPIKGPKGMKAEQVELIGDL
jgi:cold shock CspA family protein